MKVRMSGFLQFGLVFIFCTGLRAQYYYAPGIPPGNPRGLNDSTDILASNAPPVGSTILYKYTAAKNYKLQYSATQTLPFTFRFNGGPVSTYKVSSSGYLTFSALATVPAGPVNAALPSGLLPDSSICIWGMGGASDGGDIYSMVYGTSPNRQLWICYWFFGNPSDTNSQNVMSIVLEETSNNIYLVDQYGYITNSAKGIYNPIHLSLGVQISSALGFQVPGSPVLQSHTVTPDVIDNIFYTFSPDTLPVYTPQPKKLLFEEFNQASCGPCFAAAPTIDSVLKKNPSVSAIRYHVSWPGVDCMDSVTWNPFVASQCSYYNLNSIPSAELDGMPVNPTGISTPVFDIVSQAGSPFGINLTASYNASDNTVSAIAVITAYAAMPAGLVVKSVLTVDTISYKFDQSTEDPRNNSTYLLNFPQVAEAMLPGSGGKSLGAFTPGSMQTINLSWVKDHPWSADPKVEPYDSTTCTLVTYIQNNTTKYIYQSATAYISNILGVQNAAFAGDFKVYPNPAKSSITIAYSLQQSQQVSMEFYNLLGERMIALDQGTLAAGQQRLSVDTGHLIPGLYFIRLNSSAEGSSVRRLIIE